LLVIATSVGVFFWFTRRLNKIEEELWCEKRREAEAVAKQEAAAEAYMAAAVEAYQASLATFVRLEDLSDDDYYLLLDHVMMTDNTDWVEAMAIIYDEYRHLRIDGYRPNFFNYYNQPMD